MIRFLCGSGVILAAAVGFAGESRFNVDFTIGWGGCYRPMEWTPVEVGITLQDTRTPAERALDNKPRQPFGGMLTISAQQDDLTRMTIAQQFVVTPDLPLRLPLVTKIAFGAGECEVRILDQNGRERWSKEYELWSRGASSRRVTVVDDGEMLIALVGRRAFGLGKLTDYASSRTERGSGQVYLRHTLPRSLPWDWTGYRPLDLLVLYDPDWDMINVHQGEAISQWVTNGGKLLVVLGGNRLPASHPIAALLPFEVGDLKQTTVPRSTLSRWGCGSSEPTGSGGSTVGCWKVTPRPSVRICDMKKHGSQVALFASGPAGFGKVGVMAFDPSVLHIRQPKLAVKFWVEHFAALLGENTDEAGRRCIEFSEGGGGSESDDDWHFQTGLATRGSGAVLEHLLSIPELRPLSIWWVIGLLVLLAVLLGPVDYLVLKRLDRQPLTWITSTACIVVFTVGAYYGVQALRSGALQVRAVSVLDGIEGQSAAWNTTYAGLFAPKSDDYRLAKLADDQWWSGVAPMQENIYAFGQERAGRNIYCSQLDGANLPTSLPINIWSMQCLISESPSGKLPFSATVERSGQEVVARITNRSECSIKGGTIRFDDDWTMSIGPVPGGGFETFRGTLRRTGPWVDERLGRPGRTQWGWEEQVGGSVTFSRNRNAAYSAQGILPRTQGIETYLEGGAAVVCVEYDQPPLSFELAEHEADYDHIQLVRLVVFPKQD